MTTHYFVSTLTSYDRAASEPPSPDDALFQATSMEYPDHFIAMQSSPFDASHMSTPEPSSSLSTATQSDATSTSMSAANTITQLADSAQGHIANVSSISITSMGICLPESINNLMELVSGEFGYSSEQMTFSIAEKTNTQD
jgi:hypothetical protein